MKIQIALMSVGLVFLCLTGCDRKTGDASELSTPQQEQGPEIFDTIDETYQKQVKQQEADSAKMMADHTELAKRADALMKAQEEAHKKYVDAIARNEALLQQQEAFAARWAKILATWETQQEQYQKYLDSLKK